MTERWKPIASLPGYEASDLGHVRSIDRVVSSCDGRTYAIRGKMLTPSLDPRTRYWFFGASGKRVSVHRAVAEAFHGPCPSGHECAHHDGDRSNNVPQNLRWTTRLDNAADRLRHGTGYRPQGEKHHLAKLTDDDVRAIRKDPRGHTAVARDYGVTTNAIFVLRKGKTWSHVK